MNYKLCFFVELLAFLPISCMAVAMEGSMGGLFGRNTFYGLSADIWLFGFSIPLFLILIMIVKGFNSELFGTLLCGDFIGMMLEDFFWFVINPSFGLGKFNSTYATWLLWLKTDYFEIPFLYIICTAIAVISWFIFIKNSKAIDSFLRHR